MAGIFRQLWHLFRHNRSTIPDTFSLGDRRPYGPDAEKPEPSDGLSPRLEENLARLRAIFVSPTNVDLIIRRFTLGSSHRQAFIAYLDGMTDRNAANFGILQPLMYLASAAIGGSGEQLTMDYVEQALLPGNQIKRVRTYTNLTQEIVGGSSVVVIDGLDQAVSVETKGWEHRTISEPKSESVVRGPQEGFVETLRPNTAAIRRQMRAPNLVTEIFTVGARSRADVALMYLYGVANPKLVKEVRRRVQAIGDKIDFVNDTGTLEQLIEDHPRALVPQTIATERPDRCAAFLNEGHVVLVMGTSPFALIIPATFTMFIHTAEDYYLRWPYGSFVRGVRFFAGFIALLLPAIYIAIVNYHQEMLPTDLLLAIATARENVPFPAIVEVLIMEGSFELIREAGVRIPSVIGPTLGIVGALILGQAAVAASIVSPILIIIVAVTALSSFAVPNYSAAFSLRVLRFVFIILAAFLGFFGMAFGITALSVHLVSLKSFGVPFMSPIAPYRPGNTDRVSRPSIFRQPYRPWYLRPMDTIRQRLSIRNWSPDGTYQPETEKEGGCQS